MEVVGPVCERRDELYVGRNNEGHKLKEQIALKHVSLYSGCVVSLGSVFLEGGDHNSGPSSGVVHLS